MNTFVVALTAVSGGLVALADKTPDANDVKAGWGAFAIFLGLAVAVALLGWSLVRQLRKARTNAEHGVFDDDGAGGTGPTGRTSQAEAGEADQEVDQEVDDRADRRS